MMKFNGFPFYNIPLPDRPSNIPKPSETFLSPPPYLEKDSCPRPSGDGFPKYSAPPSSPYIMQHPFHCSRSTLPENVSSIGKDILRSSYPSWLSNASTISNTTLGAKSQDESLAGVVLEGLTRNVCQESAKESLTLLSNYSSVPYVKNYFLNDAHCSTCEEKNMSYSIDQVSQPSFTLNESEMQLKFQSKGFTSSQLQRRTKIYKIRHMLQDCTLCCSSTKEPSVDPCKVINQSLCKFLSNNIPLPFSSFWPNISHDIHWRLTLGAALEQRLKDSYLVSRNQVDNSQHSQHLYFLLTSKEREAATNAFLSARHALKYDHDIAFDPFEYIAPSYNYTSPITKLILEASYSVLYQSTEANKEEVSAIPKELYASHLAEDRAIKLKTNDSSISDHSLHYLSENDSLRHVWFFNASCNDGFTSPESQDSYNYTSFTKKPFCLEDRLHPQSSRNPNHEVPWDMEEICMGPYWNDHLIQYISKHASFNPSLSSKSIFWGEYSCDSNYLATLRYTLLENPLISERSDPNEFIEVFESIDRLTENEVHLQQSLLYSLSAYSLEDKTQKAFAFSCQLFDVNDTEMFVTTTPGKKTDFLPINNRPYDSSSLDIHKVICSSTEDDEEEKEKEDISSSSGLLSDVVDDSSTFNLNGGSNVTLGSVGRDRLLKDRKDLDKTMQLKKRNQEKEKRIRLALLGLAPHVARNVEDPHSSTKEAEDTAAGRSPDSRALKKPCNAIKEYRRLRRRYRSLFMIDRLRPTLDYETEFPDPYIVPVQAGLEERDCLELKHSRAAYMFLGVASQVFLTYAMRFHRLDFRTGLYEMMTLQVANSRSNTTGTGHSSITKSTKFSRFVLNLGRCFQPQTDKAGCAQNVVLPPSGSFPVRGPCISKVLRRARSNTQMLGEQYSPFEKSTQTTSSHPSKQAFTHPSVLIEKPEDLTLTDTLAIGLFEYSEQLPPLLNNLGMVAQVTKYYRPSGDHVTLAQAKKKIRGRLGRFGRLKLADSYIPFFASQMRLARNQGVVVFQSRLFKAPIFPHPTNPHNPLKLDETTSQNARYGMGRFHDFRTTDFLFIRKKTLSTSGQPTFHFYLRPIYLEPVSEFEDYEKHEHGNHACCTVYTVGQTQPFLEVPLPRSKRCLEIRRNWLRAYALRLARHGITDFQTIKARCQAKFSDVFESGVLQKHLLSCRDPTCIQNSPTYPGQSLLGTNIRVVSEESLQAVCSPEMICALESSMIGNYHLLQAGVMILRTPDRVSTAVRELEAQELVARENLLRTKRILASNTARYEQLMQGLHPSDPTRLLWEEEMRRLGDQSLFFDMLCGKRYGPIARVIEEMLLLSPWNVTRDCLDTVSRHGAQFCLDGLGDPSGGRGEGISLIRAHGSARESSLPGNSTFKNPDTPKEDLRKLSMRELHDRLIKFGFDSQIVKLLPRWDQVALVRTFQYDNSRQPTDAGLHGRLGRLSNEMYLKRINEIFLNQRIALEPDEPQLTPSDSDSSIKHENTENVGSSDKTFINELNGDDLSTRKPVSSESVDHTDLPRETNLEDELLSGLQCKEDERHEERHVNDKTFDSIERKALEDFRESLGRAKKNSEVILSTRLVEKFNPRQLQFMESKPIPRVVWSRKKKDYQTGEVKSEKVVHIYGYENIRLFYEWRKKKNMQKQAFNKNYALSSTTHMGTASRTCRRCGQIGHISSNPICPQYIGPRKARASQISGTSSHNPFLKNHFHQSSGMNSSDDDKNLKQEFLKKANGSTYGKTNISKRGRRSHALQLEQEMSEPSLKMLKHTRGKDNSGNYAKVKDTLESKSFSYSSKLPTRTTARQRLILENKGAFAGAVVQSYQGSYENAVNEINQIFQRVISKTDRDKRKWAVFREKVSEADAPGYNTVVTNPIWLNKMVEKCKAREYRSTAMFLNDIQLLVDNCFRYNPPGHWIRPLVQSLGDFLKEETESQGPWLVELDRFIQENSTDYNDIS